MDQVSRLLRTTAWTCLGLYFALGPTQSWHIVSPSIWVDTVIPGVKYGVFRTQRSLLGKQWISFFVGKMKCNNLPFNLEAILQHAPQIIQPIKPAPNVASPWIFVGFIPHHVEYMCLTKASNVLTISYSFWSHQHDVINIANQCYIQRVQLSSDYNMTEDRKVSRPLRKNYKCIMFSVLHEHELFLMFYSDRDRKLHFPNQQLIKRYLRSCYSALAKILYLTWQLHWYHYLVGFSIVYCHLLDSAHILQRSKLVH